jgi:DMSO reductase anchor subunit
MCNCSLLNFVLALIILIAVFFTPSVYAVIVIVIAAVLLLVHSLMHKYTFGVAAPVAKKKRR